jgi:hypothetical protein
METIAGPRVTHYIGTRAECEAQAAGLGFVVDTEMQSLVTRILNREAQAISYYHAATDETGLLIRYDPNGRWCFQVSAGWTQKVLAQAGFEQEGQ